MFENKGGESNLVNVSGSEELVGLESPLTTYRLLLEERRRVIDPFSYMADPLEEDVHPPGKFPRGLIGDYYIK